MLLKNSEWPLIDEPAWPGQIGGNLADRLNRLRRRSVAALWKAAAAVKERHHRRQGLRTLGGLDDRTLRDIGVSRADLPRWTDDSVSGRRTIETWR